MAGRSPRTIIGIAVVAAAVVGAVVVVWCRRARRRRLRRWRRCSRSRRRRIPSSHAPEEPVARPPQAFCEARDIAMVATSAARRAQAGRSRSPSAATRRERPRPATRPTRVASCRARSTTSSKRTGACVAQDSELDSQWNQLESAVLAYGRCIDCTHPQARLADRLPAVPGAGGGGRESDALSVGAGRRMRDARAVDARACRATMSGSQASTHPNLLARACGRAGRPASRRTRPPARPQRGADADVEARRVAREPAHVLELIHRQHQVRLGDQPGRDRARRHVRVGRERGDRRAGRRAWYAPSSISEVSAR